MRTVAQPMRLTRVSSAVRVVIAIDKLCQVARGRRRIVRWVPLTCVFYDIAARKVGHLGTTGRLEDTHEFTLSLHIAHSTAQVRLKAAEFLLISLGPVMFQRRS